MKFHTVNVAFLLAGSVSADFLSARSLDDGDNVELGQLQTVDEFYSLLPQPYGQNVSYQWVDVTEYETFDDQANAVQSVNPSSTSAGGLVPRQNQCEDLTGITRMICDNMPSREWFWGAGGALLIYYSPRLMTNWLNEVATAVQAGRNLRRVWKDGSIGSDGLGSHDELKIRNDATDYHFSLPYLLDSKGQPEVSSLNRRSVLDEGIETTLTHDYVFSEADETIYYKGTNAAFSAAAADSSLQNNTALRRRATSDYTVVMSVVKHSSANTIAKPSCIAQLLKYHLDKSSERNRFACRPIDNKGDWHATMHLMINHGQKNQGVYGTCCN